MRPYGTLESLASRPPALQPPGGFLKCARHPVSRLPRVLPSASAPPNSAGIGATATPVVAQGDGNRGATPAAALPQQPLQQPTHVSTSGPVGPLPLQVTHAAGTTVSSAPLDAPPAASALAAEPLAAPHDTSLLQDSVTASAASQQSDASSHIPTSGPAAAPRKSSKGTGAAQASQAQAAVSSTGQSGARQPSQPQAPSGTSGSAPAGNASSHAGPLSSSAGSKSAPGSPSGKAAPGALQQGTSGSGAPGTTKASAPAAASAAASSSSPGKSTAPATSASSPGASGKAAAAPSGQLGAGGAPGAQATTGAAAASTATAKGATAASGPGKATGPGAAAGGSPASSPPSSPGKAAGGAGGSSAPSSASAAGVGAAAAGQSTTNMPGSPAAAQAPSPSPSSPTSTPPSPATPAASAGQAAGPAPGGSPTAAGAAAGPIGAAATASTSAAAAPASAPSSPQQPPAAASSASSSPSKDAAAASPSPTTPPASASASTATAAAINASSSGFQLRPIHVIIFALIFVGGALFATLTLQFTAELDFNAAVRAVSRRVMKSVAFRQLCVIACAICLVRFGLNSVLRALAKFSANPVQWDKTKVYYILKEVYQPLELLLFIAAICTIADAFVPQLIAVPRSTVATVVRSTLSVSFIIGAATVVFNLKSRFCKENAWQSEMNGDVTAQRRWEAYDKLGTFVIYAITFVLGIQALGLEVTSVLAIGGIGGLAIGLAGREICENILNGFLIMSTSPFEVGDEVHFFHANKVVEGMVLDIGWYRTTIRSYEREVFVIPNAVFSKNIVLNITRKNREWRFFEYICIRVQDVHKANTIIQDIRRIVRNDQRIITKLHRRIFLDKLTHEDCRIYVSFYVEAQNREAFMTVKQDLLLAFVDCVERNGARLAVPRTTLSVEPEMAETLAPLVSAASVMANKAKQDASNATAAAAAAAQRALNDGRTITAEVTVVPSSPSPSGSAAGGTTVTKGSLGSGASSSSSGGGGSGGSGGESSKGKDGGSRSGGGSKAAVQGSDGGAAVEAAVAVVSSSTQTPKGGNMLTRALSQLAHILFET